MHQVQPVFQAAEVQKMYFVNLMQFEISILISYSFFRVFVLNWCRPAARHPHPINPSLPILNRAGKKIRWQEFMGQAKDKEITYQLPLGKNRLVFGKITLIYYQLK